MTNIDRAAGIIRAMVKIENPTHDTDVAQALADNGLLIPAPQIISNMEELEALDPDMLLINRDEDTLTVQDLIRCGRVYRARWLPAVVVATADQVRAAQKAMEEA